MGRNSCKIQEETFSFWLIMEEIRVLILTTKGGQGLISGSIALQQHFERLNSVFCHVEIVDFFEKGNIAGNILTGVYNLLLRISLRYNAVFVKLVHALRIDRWRLFYGKTDSFLLSLLNDKRPDIVIVTSEYIVHYIATASRRLSFGPPVYVANIDPGKCIPLWFHPGVQLHILPTKDTMECYLHYGFPQSKARTVGLAIRKEFLSIHTVSKEALRSELILPQSDFVVLFSGSREGYSGIIPLLRKLADETNLHIVVVCGNNYLMQTTLERLAVKHRWNTTILGWREDLHKLMGAADVVVSKPGKQTMKEAIACRVPMVSIAYPAVMEQERGNIEFMVRRNIGLVARNDRDVIDMIRHLRGDKEFYAGLLKNIHKSAAEIVPDEVVRTIYDDFLQYRRTRVKDEETL